MTKMAIVVSTSTLIGFFIGKLILSLYRERRLYYFGLTEFISHLKNNLSFKQEKLYDFVKDEIEKTNLIFSTQLKQFSEFLKGNKDISITINKFDKGKTRLEEFFKSLGTVDVYTQNEMLRHYGEEFKEKLNYSLYQEKKNGSMYFKLFILAGAVLGIILC